MMAIQNLQPEYLAINLFFTAILVFGVYARSNKQDEYAFTFIIYNLTTYLLSHYLISMIQIVGAEVGAEAFLLGLFALFGMIRYRTTPIPVYNLTFLFLAIGMGLANAVMQTAVGVPEIVVINILMVGIAFISDLITTNSERQTVKINYDNLELVKGDRDQLIKDLELRTGLSIGSVEVISVDLLRDTAILRIFKQDEAKVR